MAEFKNKEEYEKWKAEKTKKAYIEGLNKKAEPVKDAPKPQGSANIQNTEKPRAIINKGQFICTICKSQITPKTITRGSFGIELLLWILMLLPGVIYTVWRLTTKAKACPVCKSSIIVPITSPAGQEILKSLKNNIGANTVKSFFSNKLKEYVESGIEFFEVAPAPDCCPLCAAKANKKIAVATATPDGLPPFHDECRCVILPLDNDQVAGALKQQQARYASGEFPMKRCPLCNEWTWGNSVVCKACNKPI